MSQPPQSREPDRAVEAGRGALFIGFAKAFFMISGFLQRWLLTRIVGPAEYGVFALVNNAVSTINNTVVQGTVQSISKFTAEDDARADAVKRAGLRLQLAVGTGIALAFLLGAPLIADFVNAPEHTRWFRLVAAIPFLYSFYSVFIGSANGLRRFRLQASFDVGFSTAKTILLLGGAAAGAAMGHAVGGALMGFIAAAAIILVAAAVVVRLPQGGRATPFASSRLLLFMGGVVVYTLLINLALNYDLILLRRFAGAAVQGSRSDALVGNYEALRNLGLLPYQALLVVTFVIFPLVSRSTFAEDREATRAYVTQTLRYALILGSMMAVVLAARPLATLRILYKPEYSEGARALPMLVAGIVCLALLSVAGSIINASGKPQVAAALVAVTVVVGGGAMFVLVPQAPPGAPMLFAAAAATAAGMAAGLLAALIYLYRRFAAGIPPATAARLAVAALAAVAVGRIIPTSSKVVSLIALALVGVVFVAVLIALREFGPTDRAKFRKVLRR